MKYQLKRKSKNMMRNCGIFILFGCVCVFLGAGYEERILNGLAIIFVGLCLLGYEYVCSKRPVLTFDKKEFCVGETRYSYRDIERVDSWCRRSTIYVKIIANGKAVYKFDSTYENYNEFVRQLTLHGVEHRLFS